MTLTNRMYVFTVGMLCSVLLIAMGSIYGLFYHLMVSSEQERLQFMVNRLVETMQGQKQVNELLRAYLPQDGMIRVIDEQNRAIWTVTKESQFGQLPAEFTNQQSSVIRKQDGERYATVSHPLIWHDGQVVSVEMTVSLTRTISNLHVLGMVMIGISLAILFPVLWVSRKMSQFVLAPIHILIQTMLEIQESGKLKQLPLQGTSKHELYLMGKTFNQMVTILQRTFAKQRQFVADASHELKTPLTVIESYAELLKRWGQKKPEVFTEAVEAIHSEAVRMRVMTKQMLDLAQQDEQLLPQMTVVDLVVLTGQTCQQLQQAHQREITLETEESQLMVEADPQQVKQLLVILLDNGLKYSQQPLKVQLIKQQNHGCIVVRDRGAGIPEDQQHAIFDRFYRVDEARNRETGGTGLGLAIAQQIVAAHQGEIFIESQVDQGTDVFVKLPIYQKSMEKGRESQ